MTLIDLNSIHFYQAPPNAGLAGQKPSMASFSDVLDPTYNQVSDLRGTEIYGGATSDGLHPSGSRGTYEDENENFLSLEKLLQEGAGEAQESQHSGLRSGGDERANTDSDGSVNAGSNGSMIEQGGRHSSPSMPKISGAGAEAGSFFLRKKSEDRVSNPPLPLSIIHPSPRHNPQVYLKSMGPQYCDRGKEKGDKGVVCSTDNVIPYCLRSPFMSPVPESLLASSQSPLHEDAVGSAADQDGLPWMWSSNHPIMEAEPVKALGTGGIRDSSKRSTDTTGECGEGVHKLRKVCRTDDVDDALADLEFARVRSKPRPIFKRPKIFEIQQREDTTSFNSYSRVGDSQDNPFVLDDDEETTSETDISTRATSIESQTNTAHLQVSRPKEKPKTQGCLCLTATEPTNRPFDDPVFPRVALSRESVEQTIHRGNRKATATGPSPRAITITPLLPEQPQGKGVSAPDDEEWEIVKIVGKRRTRRGHEYKVRWKNSWLHWTELGNAQELLRNFEAQGRARRGRKGGRPVGVVKG